MEWIIRHRGYQTLEDAGDIGGNHHSSFGVDEPSTVARILSWIDGLPRGQGFMVTYLPIAGYHPYETPERGPFPDREEIGHYRNSLHYGDPSLGTLVKGLRDRGIAENTLWIIFGDHGEAFGQHEGNYGHTFFVYDENVRVPFIVAAPGLMHGQSRVRKVVSLVDTPRPSWISLGFRRPIVTRAGPCWTTHPGWPCSSRITRWESWACATGRGSSFTNSAPGDRKYLIWIEIHSKRQVSLSTKPHARNGMGRSYEDGAAQKNYLARWNQPHATP
jgi:hypothetical protein